MNNRYCYFTYSQLVTISIVKNLRIIARLDIKSPYLIKGIQLEGVRKLGLPNNFALKYYNEGIDEIYYEDAVASLYNRNNILEIVEETSKNVFIPLTVGGGLRSTEDIKKVLNSGADKISINTAALKDSKIISDASRKFGSSTIVLSIQAKKKSNGWEAYYDNGREHSYKDVVEWAQEGEQLGAGEILITSVDNEGTQKGFDIELINSIIKKVKIPVVASGGMGKLEHIYNLVKETEVDAIAIANCLHYNHYSVDQIKKFCKEKNISVRL